MFHLCEIRSEHSLCSGLSEAVAIVRRDYVQAPPEDEAHLTFGNLKSDIIAEEERDLQRGNFCPLIPGSKWTAQSMLLSYSISNEKII